MSEAAAEKSSSKSTRDHTYTRKDKSKVPIPETNQSAAKPDSCEGCQKPFEKQKMLPCGFYENSYCQPCSLLSKGTFEVLNSCASASWYCNHCIHAIPGVQKLLVRLGNVETNVESLKDRVETLENRETVTNENIKTVVSEQLAEQKEIEARRLNLVCLNLPESKKEDSIERQREDHDFFMNFLENHMDLDIEVNKLVRLGKREAGKTRPIRLSFNVFDHKRQILRSNSKLRKSANAVYTNIYFTPDLTKNQRKQAYELRVERRSREENGETDLKISRGKIVSVKGKKRDGTDQTRPFERGGASEGRA